MTDLRLWRTPGGVAAWMLTLVVLTLILPALWLRVAVLLVGVALWLAIRLASDEDHNG